MSKNIPAPPTEAPPDAAKRPPEAVEDKDVPKKPVSAIRGTVEFKPYHRRSCTDILCCVILILFFIVWMVIVGIGVHFGSPYSLVYGSDYEQNICGYACDTSASECPADRITSLKYAHYPRIMEDLLAQYSTISTGTVPKFYAVCVDQCPQQRDIVCGYNFERQYPSWKTDGTQTEIKRCMTAYAAMNRIIVASAGEALLTATLSAARASGSINSVDFCKETFNSCDVTPVNTVLTLNRCMPVSTQAPVNTTDRCIEPLTETACADDDLSDARNGFGRN